MGRAGHEGKGYAEFLNAHGIRAFVVDYRVSPNRLHQTLGDARRAVRMVRYMAGRLGINRDKIAVMGSSAGGHLAALVSNYHVTFPNESYDEIDRESCLPNAQILCYNDNCGSLLSELYFSLRHILRRLSRQVLQQYIVQVPRHQAFLRFE